VALEGFVGPGGLALEGLLGVGAQLGQRPTLGGVGADEDGLRQVVAEVARLVRAGGGVVQVLERTVGMRDWPTFNIADVALGVGVAAVLGLELLKGWRAPLAEELDAG
jgi:hypothetical protein